VTSGEAQAFIEKALGQAGFSPNSGGERPEFVGSIQAANRNIRVTITFPCLKFSQLPRVRLTHRTEDVPDGVAHIEADDFICYATAGSLILDLHRPGESALAVLREAGNTLERSLSRSADEEIRAEFPQHWRAAAAVQVALTPDAPEGMAAVLVLPRLDPGRRLPILTRPHPRGGYEGGAMGMLAGPADARAWIGRSPKDLSLLSGQLPTNFAEFLEWADAHDRGLSVRLLNAAADSFFSEQVHLFVSAPNGCVGVSLQLPLLWKRAVRTKGFWARCMRKHAAKIGLERLRGERMDAAYAQTRNLVGKATLAGRLIALVGCGAIGSHLARFLTQQGAGQGGGRLVLLDKDVLAAGNLGRHWLGSINIGNSKAAAVAAELKRHTPGLALQAIVDNAMNRLDVLCRAELLIDATGEEPLSRALNHEVLRRRPAGPAMIFTWLLGQGAAAQALFVPTQPDGRGCYACARPFGVQPAAMADAAPMLPVPAACGEAEFMPYGVGSPVVAAGMAAGMALEWAGGKVHPSFRTGRMDFLATQEDPDRDVPAKPECPDCGAAWA